MNCRTCRTADHAITLCTGEVYCYDCGTWTEPAPAAPPDNAGDILAAYIAAREERDGIRDDIHWGSYSERAAALPQLAAANWALHLAQQAAAEAGVLAQGRALFR